MSPLRKGITVVQIDSLVRVQTDVLDVCLACFSSGLLRPRWPRLLAAGYGLNHRITYADFTVGQLPYSTGGVPRAFGLHACNAIQQRLRSSAGQRRRLRYFLQIRADRQARAVRAFHHAVRSNMAVGHRQSLCVTRPSLIRRD